MPIKITAEINLAGIDRIVKGLRGNSVVHKLALIAEQAFVDQAPVDTGVLRANFFVSDLETDPTVDLSKKKHTRSSTPNRPVLYVINNVQYALFANLTSLRPMYIEKTINIVNAAVADLSVLPEG